MTLTLRSSTSFVSLKDSSKSTFKTPESHTSVVFFNRINQPTNFRARIVAKQTQFYNKTASAATEESRAAKADKLHSLPMGPHKNESQVPVFVMLPLDTVNHSGGLGKARAMEASLMALKSAGAEGVMVDAWWGLVEKDGPLKYNWEGYAELIQMVQKHGLKIQVVMSFHQCGGNVGDSCSIPLPPWVLEEISKNPDLVYTDRSGRRNAEYVSLGCDSLPVLRGRTPVQVYSDYMRSFRDRFSDQLGSVIVEIQVGMGPCGELRYPSYPESNGTWKYPGIGEFQCYDKYMRASLEAAAEAAGKREWGRGGPHDSGHYNQFPEETGFFRRDGTWTTDYGRFFLEWYSGMLLDHGDRILTAARAIFNGNGVKLSGKVAGIHWHYRTRSHAAELTAGYYNTRHRDGYIPLAKMLRKNAVVLNFTCMEMRDGQQPEYANCSPEGLVRQVKMATRAAGVELAGENALERYDSAAYAQILATSRSESGNGLCAFTYLRMNKRLFEAENWRNLVEFVKNMREGGRSPRLSELDSTGTDLYVGHIREKKLKEIALV